MAYHVYFEDELIDLTVEVRNHPPLMVLLVGQQSDIYLQIAEIALYCGMVLDGDYTKQDVLELCTLMTKKLIEKRTIDLHTSPGD